MLFSNFKQTNILENCWNMAIYRDFSLSQRQIKFLNRTKSKFVLIFVYWHNSMLM